MGFRALRTSGAVRNMGFRALRTSGAVRHMRKVAFRTRVDKPMLEHLDTRTAPPPDMPKESRYTAGPTHGRANPSQSQTIGLLCQRGPSFGTKRQ
jgi:hypothetical protein